MFGEEFPVETRRFNNVPTEEILDDLVRTRMLIQTEMLIERQESRLSRLDSSIRQRSGFSTGFDDVSASHSRDDPPAWADETHPRRQGNDEGHSLDTRSIVSVEEPREAIGGPIEDSVGSSSGTRLEMKGPLEREGSTADAVTELEGSPPASPSRADVVRSWAPVPTSPHLHRTPALPHRPEKKINYFTPSIVVPQSADSIATAASKKELPPWTDASYQPWDELGTDSFTSNFARSTNLYDDADAPDPGLALEEAPASVAAGSVNSENTFITSDAPDFFVKDNKPDDSPAHDETIEDDDTWTMFGGEEKNPFHAVSTRQVSEKIRTRRSSKSSIDLLSGPDPEAASVIPVAPNPSGRNPSGKSVRKETRNIALDSPTSIVDFGGSPHMYHKRMKPRTSSSVTRAVQAFEPKRSAEIYQVSGGSLLERSPHSISGKIERHHTSSRRSQTTGRFRHHQVSARSLERRRGFEAANITSL
jgi:hypothetical protein